MNGNLIFNHFPWGSPPLHPGSGQSFSPFAVSFERKVFIFTHMHKNTMYLYHDNKHQLILLTACFEGSLMGLMGRQMLNTDKNPDYTYYAEQSIVIF